MRILALSACSRTQLDVPSYEVDESAPISLTAGSVGTKALIEGENGLDKAGTELQVYDYLSPVGSTATVKYIDDQIKWHEGQDPWDYVTGGPYYWTKTGTHKFFGWLTKDGDLTATGLFGSGFSWDSSTQTLTIPATTMTPDKPQFDFLYSNIVTRNAATASDRKYVDLSMSHLFTALSVELSNGSDKAITDISVTLTGIQNGRGAEIHYAGDKIEPQLTNGTLGELLLSNPSVVSLDAPAEDQEATTPVSVYTTDPFRLLWPQDDLSGAGISVTYTYDGKLRTRTASLKDVITGNQMTAGKKYTLTVTITYNALYVLPRVADWVDEEPLDYDLNMSTNMRLFDSWLYRYDTVNQDYSDWTNWAGSHMVVSDGRVTEATQTEIVVGRPLRSPQIQLVTTGSNTFSLKVDNENFEIIRANKNATGTVASYEASENGVLTIPASTTEAPEVYTYFYIVPKAAFEPTDENRIAKVSLIYNDSVTGPQKVTFNYNALPGYSDDSSEIWAYYVQADQYNIEGKLKMYFQDYNHPLVPTAVQN